MKNISTYIMGFLVSQKYGKFKCVLVFYFNKHSIFLIFLKSGHTMTFAIHEMEYGAGLNRK